MIIPTTSWFPVIRSCWSRLPIKDLKLKQISVIDRPTEHINEYFDTAFDFIDSCLDNGTTSNAVFVHCQRGISRSATIVMAYAIFHGMTLSEITSTILKSRPQVKPNVGFWKILCDYEFKCLGKNTVTINHWKERQVNEDDNNSSKQEKNCNTRYSTNKSLSFDRKKDKFPQVVKYYLHTNCMVCFLL